MALAYVGGLKGSWMADDIMTDGGRRCVDNLVDLRTITLRMFRPTYATRSVHFRRIRFRHTRIPDPVIDHCDLPPVIGQRICGGRVKKKGGEGKKDKMGKKDGWSWKNRVREGKEEKKKEKETKSLKRVVSSPWRTDSIPKRSSGIKYRERKAREEEPLGCDKSGPLNHATP